MDINKPILSDNTNPYSNQPAGYGQYPPQFAQPIYPPQQGNYQPQQPGYQQPGYQQQPVSQQPPQNYPSAQPQGDYKYEYDPMNIQYHQMSINQWGAQQNDPSPYYQFWNGPQAFQPQTFATNQKSNNKWNDLVWTVIFWINFAGTIGFFGYAAYLFSNDVSSGSNQKSSELEFNQIIYPVLIGLAIAFVVNIIHFCYVSFAPLIYIKFGFFIGVILSVLCCIYPVVSFGNFIFFIYPGFMLLFALIMWCICRPYFEVSAAVLKQTCALIRKYPSIIFFAFFQVIIDIVINIIFCLLVFFIITENISYWSYLYVLFSYFWISLTFSYVTYMTGAGLAASWYFLDNTVYFPRHPVWQSFKRAATTSFGSAAFAGFILAVVEFLKQIVSDMDQSSSDGSNMVVCVFRCIALCILSCLEAFVKWMNRYALIYCSVFGVPFSEGCRRWAELSCKRFCDVIISGCVVSRALSFNLFLFTAMAAVIGALVALPFNSTVMVFLTVSATVFGLAIFIVLKQPIETISDTIFVCFAENPERLNSTASDLAGTISEMYNNGINSRIH